jgi:hypothetical protein
MGRPLGRPFFWACCFGMNAEVFTTLDITLA